MTEITPEKLEFLDELFANLFDQEDISSDTDKVPDLGLLTENTQQE